MVTWIAFARPVRVGVSWLPATTQSIPMVLFIIDRKLNLLLIRGLVPSLRSRIIQRQQLEEENSVVLI